MRRPSCFIATGSVLIDLPLHVGRVPAPGGAVTATSSGPTVGGGYTVVSAVARQGVPAADPESTRLHSSHTRECRIPC